MDATGAGTRVRHVIQEPSDVLVASHAADELMLLAGFAEQERADIAIAVRELATNILKHAGAGEVRIWVGVDAFEVEAVDEGPGILSVERAVTDGYSSAGSLGYGLGTVNRLMDDMVIESVRGRGTTVTARRQRRVHEDVPGRCPLDIGVATLAKPGYDENGDAFVVRLWGTKALVGVIDGVGHGGPAKVASQAARRYVESHHDQPLDGIFRGAATACRGTRGVVMALGRFDWGLDRLEFASVGNIEARVLGAEQPINFVVRRGIIGLNAPPPRLTTHAWPAAATLVMYSDGVQDHWGPDALDGLAEAPASAMARTLLDRLGRETDDATVLVVKGRADAR